MIVFFTFWIIFFLQFFYITHAMRQRILFQCFPIGLCCIKNLYHKVKFIPHLFCCIIFFYTVSRPSTKVTEIIAYIFSCVFPTYNRGLFGQHSGIKVVKFVLDFHYPIKPFNTFFDSYFKRFALEIFVLCPYDAFR